MTRRRLNRIRLDKVAAVDSPCQEPATVALIKRAPRKDATPAIAKRTFDEALRGQLISERVSEVFWRAFDKQWAVREAFREALADELDAGGDGSAATEGFVEAMRTIAETAAELAREAGADATDDDLEAAVEQAVEKWLSKQETSDMKITTKAALKAAVAAFDPNTTPVAHVGIIKQAAKDLGAEDELPADGPLAVEKADPTVANLTREVAVLKMAEPIRKHFDALDAAGQTAFLAKSEADRAAEVEAANATDPVVYKCVDGTEIRKSDGPAVLALAKRSDEKDAQIATLQAQLAGDGFEKRAVAEYPNVAKAVAVDMLKSIAKLGKDTDAGKAIQASLDQMNKGQSTLFKSLGTTDAPAVAGDVQKARTDFNTEVGKIAKRDNIGTGDAMSKARVEFPELFAEAYPDTAQATADAADR